MRLINFRYRINNQTTKEIKFYYYTLEELENGKLLRDFKGQKVTIISRDAFTGPLDKNGKEIYEEDIVRYTSRDNFGGESGISKVYWDDKSVGFRPFSNDNELDGRVFEDIEVIGNTYENFELLEEKK